MKKLLRDLKNYSRKSLDSLQPYIIGRNKITLYHGIFNDLMDSEIRAFTDKKIVDGKAVVIIVNAHNDGINNNNSPASEPTATIVVAANESIKDIDCNRIVKEVAGRGGGKPYFATGMIKINEASDIVGNIATLVKNKF